MLKYRRAFLKQRRAAVTIQARVKGTQARAAYAQLRKQHAAATALQACFRGHQARQHYLLQRDAAVALQMGFRRRQVSNTWVAFVTLECHLHLLVSNWVSAQHYHFLCLLLRRSDFKAFVTALCRLGDAQYEVCDCNDKVLHGKSCTAW